MDQSAASRSRRALVHWGVALAGVLFLATAVTAQTGTIAGVVRDTTGAVLPGVTVEASSPALIEKVRTATTTEEGQYRIIDLRPGSYVVTFTLTGFSVVRREGIELSGGVTVTVSVDLQVGSLEETLTVSGQAPLVDVQNSSQTRAVSREILNEIPSGRQFGNYAVLIPGVVSNQQDVGGNESGRSGAANPNMSVHGSVAAEMPLMIEGMRYSNIFGVGGASSGPYFVNNGMVQEISIDTSGANADAEVPGVRANVIFKQGGNLFSGMVFGSFSNDALQADNVDDSLRALGAPTSVIDKRIWDFNVGFGGPIRQDRMWFYASFRHYGLHEIPPGAFFDVNPSDVFWTPDTGREIFLDSWNVNYNFRTTFQTSSNSKMSVYGDYMPRCICKNGLSASTSYEATTVFKSPVNSIVQAIWTWTVRNNLLIELGETWKPDSWEFEQRPDIPADLPGISDSGLGITYRANTGRSGQESNQFNGKAVVTYVTGEHNLKMGAQWFHGTRTGLQAVSGDHFYNFNNQVPVAVTIRTTPIFGDENLDMNLGLFVQEQWTRRRLTLNLGLRYDHLEMSVPEQSRPARRFVGPLRFDAIEDIVAWHDVSPRMGATFDLFGDSRTAVKWFMGRYIEAQAANFIQVVNPMRATAGTQTTISWKDDDLDFFPDCDLTNRLGSGECGPYNNGAFGTNIVTTAYDPDAVTGWGTRGWNWEVMAGVQHQLLDGLSFDVSYHRRWFGNFRVTDNLDVTPADYDEYCVTSPVDTRLPGSGGEQICGLFDIRPDKFGVNRDLSITSVEPFGKHERVFDGVDVSANLRLPNGFLIQGGTSTGRTRTSECAIVDSPNQRFCDVTPPMQTQVKLQGIAPLPLWGIQMSGSLQSLPGPEITAVWSAPVAQVTGLNRPISGGARTVSVPLVEPGTVYGDRLYQVDFRFAKNFRLAWGRLQPQFDLYNMFNSNPVTALVNNFGARWQTPTRILAGRIIKFGMQVDF